MEWNRYIQQICTLRIFHLIGKDDKCRMWTYGLLPSLVEAVPVGSWER